MSDTVVVIGAGQAAAQLAMSLRQGGFAAPIRLIGDEPHLPYQRPPLSKKFLIERKAPGTRVLRAENFWRDQDVTLDLGVTAAMVETKQRRVSLTDVRQIPYG